MSHGRGMPVRLVLLVALTVAGVCAGAASSALALSSGRAYELVSPPFKGGFGATLIEGVREDGNGVIYYSPGAFAGASAGFSVGLDSARYLATREGAGWSTVALVPPSALSNEVIGDADFAPSLSQELVQLQLEDVEDPSQFANRIQFFLHSVDTPEVGTDWASVGPIMQSLNKEPVTANYHGASSDFCHLIFEIGGGAIGVLPGSGSSQLYELVSGCHGEPAALRFVALNDHQKLFSPDCTSEAGGEAAFESGESSFNAVAAEGSEIFFTTCIANSGSDRQLFVRLDGTRTLEISKPLVPKAPAEACGKSEIPCKGAETRASTNFAGASEDGSRVFFTSEASLTGEAEDTSRNLYLATIGCPEGEPECVVAGRTVTSLTRVSRTIDKAEAADVQGVVRVAPDGSRVYFVAQGVLSEGARGQGGAPVRGADNLYVYERDAHDPAGRVAFVAELCSGQDASGEAEDVHCPNTAGDTSLWFETGVSPEAQTAGVDGRSLVFCSYGQLTAGDTDSAKDVYRYDAETGVLERISVGEGGYDGNGNDSRFDATILAGHHGGSVSFQHELNSRAISEDGSRIVFTTSEPLSPQAVNGLSNLYEWHQGPEGTGGEVSLVSGGSGDQPVTDGVISPSGQDVFFATTQALVSQDTDELSDVYDARIGGGFPEAPAPRQQCSSDACQGPLTNPAPLLVPGSVSQAPGENLPAPMASPVTTKSRPKSAKCKKGHVRRKGRCVKEKQARSASKRHRGGGK
ncbi:MAG TPA: hypothetical protein VGL57_09760 [Solirubrobacteraceae bacterium]